MRRDGGAYELLRPYALDAAALDVAIDVGGVRASRALQGDKGAQRRTYTTNGYNGQAHNEGTSTGPERGRRAQRDESTGPELGQACMQRPERGRRATW